MGNDEGAVKAGLLPFWQMAGLGCLQRGDGSGLNFTPVKGSTRVSFVLGCFVCAAGRGDGGWVLEQILA